MIVEETSLNTYFEKYNIMCHISYSKPTSKKNEFPYENLAKLYL